MTWQALYLPETCSKCLESLRQVWERAHVRNHHLNKWKNGFKSSQVRSRSYSNVLKRILNGKGLKGTPERYAKALMYFTKGYEENVRDPVNGAVFHEDHD